MNLLLLLVIIMVLSYINTKLGKKKSRKKRKRKAIISRGDSSLAKEKGLEFEEKVYSFLKSKYPDSKILRNLILPKKKGGSSEIDLLFLHKDGMICLECKNYNCLVLGSKDSYKWTVYYNKDYKVELYSPIFQNSSHIKTLKGVLGGYYFHNVVVFSETSELSDGVSSCDEVITFNKLHSHIDNILKKSKNPMSNADIASVYNLLKKYENKGVEEHIEYVNSIKKVNS